MKVLGLITARKGSQGLKDKNIAKFEGKTLLEHAIALLLASARQRESWDVVVSTDSSRYADIAKRAGAQVPFKRPQRLATSRARQIDVVLHALETLEKDYDLVVLCAPCTPLTQPSDVRKVVTLWRKHPEVSVSTVTQAPTSPDWMFELQDGVLHGKPRIMTRRQETPHYHVMNGALFAASPSWLHKHRQFIVAGKTRAVVMPPERSVDIDTPLDLEWARFLQRTGRSSGH